MPKTIYLVDGSGYIYRAYYAIRPLSTSTGVPTHAVLGFAKMLQKLIKDERPAFLGVAFDPKGKSFRHDIYSEYKANRQVQPEDLSPQIPLIHELVDAMDIPRLVVPGWEADDVLATLTVKARAAGFDVVVVSGDKDLLQLVRDGVTMFDPMKDKHYGPEAVYEKFGVAPERVSDLLGLSGDQSDNIPGVPKVGPKTAAKLINEYGDLEQIIVALEQRGKLKSVEQGVLQHRDDARLSKRLATLDYAAPIELDPDALRYSRPSAAALRPFLQRIEAFALMRELEMEEGAPPEEAPVAAPPAMDANVTPIDRSTYVTIGTLAALDALLAQARAAKRLAVDTETTSLDAQQARLVGLALATDGAPPAYVPLTHHYLGVPEQLRLGDVLPRVQAVLADGEVIKVGQNIKYDAQVLERVGITIGEPRVDTMLAAYVLDPSRPSFGLDSLARELLGHETIKYQQVTGTGKKQISFDEVPVERATEYAAEDVDVTLRLADVVLPLVEKAGLADLFYRLEMPLVAVLADMERTGILVDRAALASFGAEIEARVRKLEESARAEIGEDINLASPKQLADLFFNKLQLSPHKRTKTGFSVDAEVLELLAAENPIARTILEHRTLCKLKSTYVDALLKMAHPETGRVHTSFNQTGAATGRLSSSDPNLQNIPIRTEDGRRIRAAFVAPPGRKLLSADYSQIELRLVAHLAQDDSFIEAFKSGEDIHSRTAREILTGGAEPDAEMRRRAKAINFGILYGLSEFGLAKQLDIPREEARAYITAYFGRYPKIRIFLDHTIEEGRERGYVGTLLGRRRFLPDLRSKNTNIRRAAERVAMNTPMQGSAADIIKKAMIELHVELARRHPASKLLLQVHDELVLEVPDDDVAEVGELVRRHMSQVVQLLVPLEVDVGVGQSWAAAH